MTRQTADSQMRKAKEFMRTNKTNILKVELNNGEELYLSPQSFVSIECLGTDYYSKSVIIPSGTILVQEGLVTNNLTMSKNFHFNRFCYAIFASQIRNITTTLEKIDVDKIKQYTKNTTLYLTRNKKRLIDFKRKVGDIIYVGNKKDKPLQIISMNSQEKTCKALPCQSFTTTAFTLYKAMRTEITITINWEDISLLKTNAENFEAKLKTIIKTINGNMKLFKQINKAITYTNNIINITKITKS